MYSHHFLRVKRYHNVLNSFNKRVTTVMSNLDDCFLVVIEKLHEKKRYFSLRKILGKITFELAYNAAFSCVFLL